MTTWQTDPPHTHVEFAETFGPVVVVEAVDTPEEAIAANRTMYGLTSSILAGNT